MRFALVWDPTNWLSESSLYQTCIRRNAKVTWAKRPNGMRRLAFLVNRHLDALTTVVAASHQLPAASPSCSTNNSSARD